MVAEAPLLGSQNVSKHYKQYGTYRLVNRPDNFVAGKTAKHKNQWCKITSDKWILQTICGYAVELTDNPIQTWFPNQIKFSELDQIKIDHELSEFLQKGIIEPVYTKDHDEFISNIFIRPKSDGGICVILNLKPFKWIRFTLRWKVYNQQLMPCQRTAISLQ